MVDGGWGPHTGRDPQCALHLHRTKRFNFAFPFPSSTHPHNFHSRPDSFCLIFSESFIWLSAQLSISVAPADHPSQSHSMSLDVCVCLSVKWVYFSAKLLKMAFLVEIFIALFLCFNSSLREEKFCQLQINGNRFRSA